MIKADDDPLDKHCVLCFDPQPLLPHGCRDKQSPQMRQWADLVLAQIRKERLDPSSPAGVSRAIQIAGEIKDFLQKNTLTGE